MMFRAYYRIRQQLWFDIIMSLLAVATAVLLVYEVSTNPAHVVIREIMIFDMIVAVVFLADLVVAFIGAPNKWRFVRDDGYLLLASIPVTNEAARSLRVLRLLRLVRVIKLLLRVRQRRAARHSVGDHGIEIGYATLITTVAIATGTIAFYVAETHHNPHVSGLFDALWWTVVTISTIGYGDITPVTTQGRVVGMVMALFGVALTGAIAGIVGATLLGARRPNRLGHETRK